MIFNRQQFSSNSTNIDSFSLKKLAVASLRQLTSLMLLLCSLYLIIVLKTYDASDPSWNTVVEGPVQNSGGSLGAIVADLLRQLFGISAYFSALTLSVYSLTLLGSTSFGRFKCALLLLPLSQWIFSCLCAHMTLSDTTSLQQGGALGSLSFAFLRKMAVTLSVKISSTHIFIFLCLVWISFLLPTLNLTLRDVQMVFKNIKSKRIRGVPILKSWFLKGTVVVYGFYRKLTQRFLQSKKDLFHSSFSEKEDPILFPEKDSFPNSLFSKDQQTLEEQQEQKTFNQNIREGQSDRQDQSLVSTPMSKNGPSPKPQMRYGNVFKPDIKISTPMVVESVSESLQSVSNCQELTLEEHYCLPDLDLLSSPPLEIHKSPINEAFLMENAKQLMSVLEDFGIRGEVTKVHPGPVVTLYELVPAPGIKASRVIGLADDIARSMSAHSTRIAVIPGHNAIGIELPNKVRQTVYLRELLTSRDYETTGPKLPLGLGKDIGGIPIIVDLARMPHLLVAGTTGAGKSVAINTMILSLLYRLSPKLCRFIMIDPKMLELSVYDGIPHLLTPVVTEPKKAVFALKWTVKEMEDRYRAMSKLGVRNIEGYNTRLAQALTAGEELTRQVQTGFDEGTGRPLFETQPLDMTPLPYIVVVVDEMADLMLVAGKDIEATVQRLAQMARAAGIHLIMATQRPSVDVITGTIKANFPTRISFQVTSRFDSRTILGEQGAEQLLGRGDMLYMEGGGKIQRVHGPFVSDEEVIRVVQCLKNQGQPDYIDTITEEDPDVSVNSFGAGEGKEDALYQQAVQLVRRERKASTSFIQRHLRVGYNTAARLMEQMEMEGVVSVANHVGKREILLTNG